MHEEQAHLDAELRHLFPKLKPIKSSPWMFRLNGFGASVYGKRDFHEPTQSYVKTHCLCGLFIPLVALGAYRVVEAESGGWYFLGKEPLSGFAKGWNYLLLAAVLVLSGVGIWDGYYNTPEARAQRNLKSATHAFQSGDFATSARKYRDVLNSRTSLQRKGVAGLLTLKSKLETMSLSQAQAVVSVLLDVHDTRKSRLSTSQVPLHSLYVKVSRLVEKRGAAHPLQAFKLLKLVSSLAIDRKAHLAHQQRLLEAVVAQNPKDLKMVSQLAVIYEKQKRYARCVKILEPVRLQLKEQEGARVLGQIYFRKGKLNAAYQLLLPYTEGRLKRLRRAEKKYRAIDTSFRKRVWRRARRRLRRHSRRVQILGLDYRSLSKVEKQRRYLAYVQNKVQRNPGLRRARQSWIRAARIVPVAMDLGIVLLYRARRVKDAKQRNKELQDAERIFLAIRGVAGRSSRYQLSLGQVYYWMGKPRKGQKLFDRVLRQTKRSYRVLMRLASVMRELGESGRAGMLAEEAYKTGKTPKLKHRAAYIRALTSSRLEERVRWLLRSGNSPRITIALNSARGEQAQARGNLKQASRYFRKVIKGYQDMDKSSYNLNNCALVYFSLFRVTGEKRDFLKGLKLLEKALTLKPSDSIMLGNTAHFLLSAAIIDVVGDSVDWRSLRTTINLGLLSYFYNDEASKRRYIKPLMENKKLRLSVSRYQKKMILAPKSSNVYNTLPRLYWLSANEKGMRDLRQHLRLGKYQFLNLKLYRTTAKSRALARKGFFKIQRRIRRQKRLVRSLRYRSRVDYAIAVTTQIQLQLAAFALGGRVAAKPLVALAERAYRRLPSSATHQSLVRTLYYQLSDNLARRHAGYARMLRAYKRNLSPGYLLAYAIFHKPEILRLIRRDRSLQKLLRRIKQSVVAFPLHGYATEWAFVKLLDKDLAQTIADRILKNPLHQLYSEIRETLFPNSPTIGLLAYFRAHAAGRPEKAKQIWRRFRLLGAPMPSFRIPNKGRRSKARLKLRGQKEPYQRGRHPVRTRKSGDSFLGSDEEESPKRKPKKRGSNWLE